MTKKIVIVEDEFRIRQGLSNLINKVDMGCRVIGEAENGYEGITPGGERISVETGYYKRCKGIIEKTYDGRRT